MIFSRPIPFVEALASHQVRMLLPTTLSAQELGEMDASLRERALVIARVSNARFLQEARDGAEAVVRGELTQEAAIQRLRELRGRISGGLPEGERGTMQDIFSDQRLALIVRMQVEQAFGYGQWRQGQTQPVLDRWPCQEFYRAAWRKEPRDWPTVWAANGGRFFPGVGSYPEGRMIARKDSPIWVAINRFGVPYMPADYNSGMDLRDVAREVAVHLGVIEPGDRLAPQSRDFEADIGMSAERLDADLREELLDELGGEYVFQNGVLERANEALLPQLTNELLIRQLAVAGKIRRIEGGLECTGRR